MRHRLRLRLAKEAKPVVQLFIHGAKSIWSTATRSILTKPAQGRRALDGSHGAFYEVESLL
jgi:hypothetical protein